MKKRMLWEISECARFNRAILETVRKCGCYYCLKLYSPSEIEEWSSEPREGVEKCTAICPYCGVDAVLAESSKYPLTKDFLREMRKEFFEN